MNNQLLFAPEDQGIQELSHKQSETWKIAIIDDDILVHQVTKMVLEDFMFDNQPVEFLGAFSQEEGYKLFEENDDIAVCILDVIMETDTAGIDLAQDIREKLNNSTTRIVLRTGQPGLSVEEDIISKYSINDYKNKTELTSSKLRTVITSCIRTYVEMTNLNKAKIGMRLCMDACGELLSSSEYSSDACEFAKKTLESIPKIFNQINSKINSDFNGLIASIDNSHLTSQILASRNEHGDFSGHKLTDILPDKVHSIITNSSCPLDVKIIDNSLISCHERADGTRCVTYLKDLPALDDTEQEILEAYLNTMMHALVKRFIY